MNQKTAITVFALAGVFFLLFFIYPIVNTLQEAFFGVDGKFTFRYILAVFQDEIYLEGLLNAFKIGFFTTLLSLFIALPLAFVADRYIYPGKQILSALILVPLILPPFVGAIGIKALLGQKGAVNAFLGFFGIGGGADAIDWLGEGRLTGIVIMNALHLYPILYLNIAAALANLDPAMEEAAQDLGCPYWKRLLKITLPLTMPGIFAGCTIVFIWAFTELGVPLMFDYSRVTSVQIFDHLKDLSGNPFPYALVTVMLVASVMIFIVSKVLFGGSNFAAAGRASMASTTKRLPKWQTIACTSAFVIVTTVALLPHLSVLAVSVSKDWYDSLLPAGITFSHYSDALGHDLTVNSIWNSIKYASLATMLNIVIGISIAYVVVRTKLPGRQVLDSMAMLPLAVPGLVLAFGYLAMTREGQTFDFLVFPDASTAAAGAQDVFILWKPFLWIKAAIGTFFSFIIKDGNPVILLVIAYSVRRMPYIVRSAVAGFQQTNVQLEEAAQNLGASPFRALRRITIPLIAANLIAGALLAFSFAMLEVSDSLILAEKMEHFPITKAIYSLTSTLGIGHHLASALGVWAMIFLGITIIGASLLLGKKMGALFRV